MRSITQLAITASITGVMVAIASLTLGSQTSSEGPPPLFELSDSKDPLSPELARCAVVTTPDAACETIWAAHRRRFFGEASASTLPAPTDNASVLNVVPGKTVTADEPLP